MTAAKIVARMEMRLAIGVLCHRSWMAGPAWCSPPAQSPRGEVRSGSKLVTRAARPRGLDETSKLDMQRRRARMGTGDASDAVAPVPHMAVLLLSSPLQARMYRCRQCGSLRYVNRCRVTGDRHVCARWRARCRRDVIESAADAVVPGTIPRREDYRTDRRNARHAANARWRTLPRRGCGAPARCKR